MIGQSVDSLSHKEAEEQQEHYFASLDKKDDVRPEVKGKIEINFFGKNVEKNFASLDQMWARGERTN